MTRFAIANDAKQPWNPPPPTKAGGSSQSSSSASSSSSSLSGGVGDGAGDGMRRIVAENPVLVVGLRGCCMCHVARRLLLALGVNPAVRELGEDAAEEAAALVEEMAEAEGDRRRLPAMLPVVFIGGRLLGGLDRLMAVHISGELVPILKEAGALWL